MPRRPFPEIACLKCGSLFTPKIEAQRYCERRCFKRAYKRRKGAVGCPSYRCIKCAAVSTLEFDPRKNHKAWFRWKCACGYRPCATY